MTAARILVEAAADDQLGTETDHQLAPEAAAAVLALVATRTRDIGRMLRGELAAEALCAPHNIVQGPDIDGHDVVFGVTTKPLERRKTLKPGAGKSR